MGIPTKIILFQRLQNGSNKKLFKNVCTRYPQILVSTESLADVNIVQMMIISRQVLVGLYNLFSKRFIHRPPVPFFLVK